MFQKGFTLVELAIVLVILGLLIGGVLVGQDMIKAGELRAQIKNIEKYNSAAQTFRNRFSRIPGDIPNYRNFVDTTVWNDIQNGDGDKQIRDGNHSSGGSRPDIDEFSGEIAQFWLHLSSAALVNGAYDGGSTLGESMPYAVNEQCGVGIASVGQHFPKRLEGNYFQIGLTTSVNPGTDDTVVTQNCLSPQDAYMFDLKADDGNPWIGVVQATGNANGAHQGMFFGQPDYMDLGALEPDDSMMMAALQELFHMIIPTANASSVVSNPEDACVLWQSSVGDFTRTGAYNRTTGNINCQLAIKTTF